MRLLISEDRVRRQSQEFHFSKIVEKVLGIKIYQQEKRDTPPAEEVVLASSILNSFSTAAHAGPHLRCVDGVRDAVWDRAEIECLKRSSKDRDAHKKEQGHHLFL